jgi:hypothetical protein
MGGHFSTAPEPTTAASGDMKKASIELAFSIVV